MSDSQIAYVCLKCFAEYSQSEACQQYYRCWRHPGALGKDGIAGLRLKRMEVRG